MSTPESEFEPPAPRVSDLARADARPADYLDGLNPEQRAAVEATEGPVLVLAGAGTGKTRVLTTRLAHILATGKARPWSSWPSPSPTKAAREMRERITAIIGPAGRGPDAGSAPSTRSPPRCCAVTPQAWSGLKSPNYTILDDDDQERLLETGAGSRERRFQRALASQDAGRHDRRHWKNRGWRPDQACRRPKALTSRAHTRRATRPSDTGCTRSACAS